MNISKTQPSERVKPQGSGYNELTEAELIERAQGGDQEAFRRLVVATQEKAYSVALGYCKNPEDAMDRVQEAYVKAFRSITRFQGGSTFYTWFYRILMNGCIDFSRREAKRKRDVGFDEGLEGGESAVETTTGGLSNSNPARNLANQELGEKIHSAMEKLSDAHREILVLREIQGLSYEELADLLGIARGTVMSRLHHAREKLKRSLEGYVHGE